MERIPTLEIKEVGIVKEVKRGIAKVDGLPSCIYGQLVQFPHNIKGMVIGFSPQETAVIIFGDERHIGVGDKVTTFSELFHVAVGDNFLGRVVNSVCEPIDGAGKITPSDNYPVFRRAPGVMAREPIGDAFLTGIKIIDFMIPIGKGQRELIVGDRQTGKTSVAQDAIINQKGKDVVCIYCWIGGSYATFENIMHVFKANDVFPYLVSVCAPAASSAAEQYLCPYTAASLGEYFMHQGKDVFVVFDDLTKHAWVYRQMSLLLERAPGREAYPGDIFFLHSQLMERAGRMNSSCGGGTMTFFPIVETLQGDITGYIQSNLVSMTDGQIYLDAGLFQEGFKPAIDLGLSVSRIGSKVQNAAVRELGGGLRLEYAQYREMLRLTRLRTRLSAEASARMRRGAALQELLTQPNLAPLSLAEEIVVFYAFSRGILEKISLPDVKCFKTEFFKFLMDYDRALGDEISRHGSLTEEVRKGLDKVLAQYFKYRAEDKEEAS